MLRKLAKGESEALCRAGCWAIANVLGGMSRVQLARLGWIGRHCAIG